MPHVNGPFMAKAASAHRARFQPITFCEIAERHLQQSSEQEKPLRQSFRKQQPQTASAHNQQTSRFLHYKGQALKSLESHLQCAVFGLACQSA